MNRRCIVARLTITALLLLPPLSIEAKKAASGKPAIAAKSRPSAVARKRNVKSASRRKTTCVPCAALASQNNKGRTLAKHARAAKRLPCHPKNYVDPKIARNYKAALRDMKRAGIKPRITSVWRSSETQARLRRCSLNTRCRRANPGLYRALPSGKSMHEAGFAVDIAGIASGPRGNKQLTSQGRRIVGIMRRNGFKWRYGLSDPAHFEADPRKYGYRTPQQAIHRTQTTCQVNLAQSRARKKSGSRVSIRTSGSKLKTVPVATKIPQRAAKHKA